ncbi:MAG: hypothetical protein RLZZ117_1572 [Cyanobacteriota bacterium]
MTTQGQNPCPQRTCGDLWLLALSGVLAVHPVHAVTDPGECAKPRGGDPLTVTPILQAPASFRDSTPAAPEAGDDYRHRLRTTPFGWPVRRTWCVWVEPVEPGNASPVGPARWWEAVNRALEEWSSLVSIQRVPTPDRAHVTIWRRRPPLGVDGAGRARASHGRAILSLHRATDSRSTRIEPRVRVLISPDQRLEALQATALHELGHAFGLWGHSDQSDDAMAATPGRQPILRLSPRDRATVRWLYGQPSALPSDP